MADERNTLPRARIVRTTLRNEIKKLVVERILDGVYPPGSRIVESRLAREFGTSQAPVREALRDLEGMNLIESIPHKGAYVRQQDRKRYVQAYPVRAALEEFAGREAAGRISEAAIDELRSTLDAMRAAAKEGDVKSHMKHDIRFHEIIVEATENSVLLDLWHALSVEPAVLISAIKMDLDLPMIAEMHSPILDAMRIRNAELSAKLLREHITFFGSIVVRGSIDPSAVEMLFAV
jgi:DNA-binding GntR family transcriptional regulator